MDKVSIVIPCFNSGAFVREAVESALSQTYPDIEVVIVDDGSTDDATRTVLDSFSDQRVSVVRQSNAGPAAARNTGVRAAQGALILPLDADDRIHPTYVAKAHAVLISDPTIGAVYCKAMKFGADSGPWNLSPFSVEKMVIDNVVFCSALYRKADWARVGGYSESLRHGVEDYDYWLKFIEHGLAIRQLDEYLFDYRVQKSSRQGKFTDNLETMVETYAAIYRAHSDFFSKHAEVIYRHRFSLYREVEALRAPYRPIQKLLSRVSPSLYSFARRTYTTWTQRGTVPRR